LGDIKVNTLLQAATACAVDAHLLREDMADLLFPRVAEAPSEALQAAVRITLQKLVKAAENRLFSGNSDGTAPQSWEMLARSGLLREPQLIEFCMGQIAMQSIQQRLDEAGVEHLEQLPARSLGDIDPVIAEAASKLLAAQALIQTASAAALLMQLPADVLHVLIWRIVAVFQSSSRPSNLSDSDLVAKARDSIAQHDESRSLQSSAAKLAYFLPEEQRGALNNATEAGLALFVAGLAQEFRLSQDRVLRLIDEAAVAPLLTMLRARGFEASEAFAQILLLRGQRHDDPALAAWQSDYDDLDPDAARQAIIDWRIGSITDQGAS
jgi:hypothetical protein